DMRESRGARKERARDAFQAKADMAAGGMAAAPAMAPRPAEMAQMANAAASSDATTQVLFKFPQRVDLAAGNSMMLPFLSGKLPMEQLWVYQPDTHPTHPLASILLKNDGAS